MGGLREGRRGPALAWNEHRHHGPLLPAARPEIVSGNRGALPAPARGPAGR